MEHQQSGVEMFEKFTWKVENFSRLTGKLYSEPVVLGGYQWRIVLFPKGKNIDYLSIFLEAVQSANLPSGWSREVKFSLIVLDQINSDNSITKECNHKFNAAEYDWGFKSFMPLSKLLHPFQGFLVKDACIVGAEVAVPRPEPEGQGRNLETLSPVSKQVCIEPAKHTDVELFSASIGELMNFRGLGQIEKVFVPLLEEVCSKHPSLTECQQKRSRKFTEWAFTALGRVLYFLKTRKVKDMNDQGYKDLQNLWEELEAFRFDLTWLEPHVQSALGMQSYVEKAMQVEKLRESMVALEFEMERLKAALVTAEVNLDAERDLLKGKGFEERDLDAELGYGRP